MLIASEIIEQTISAVRSVWNRCRETVSIALDVSPIALFILNTKGEVIHENLAWKQALAKFDTSEKSRKSPLFCGDTFKSESEILEKLIATRDIVRCDVYSDILNIRHWFSITYFPIFSIDDEFDAIGGIALDLTEKKQSEARLAELSSIIRYSDDAIITKDLNGIVTSWNLGAERIFGYKADEMIGTPIARLIPFNAENEEPAILRRIRSGETIEHYETKRRRKDGQIIDVSLAISPLIITGGQIIGASKIVRDITERKLSDDALKSSENLKSSILNSAIDAIITMDHTGRVVDFNPSAEQIFGYKKEQLVGQIMADFIIPQRFRNAHNKGLNKYLETGKGPVIGARIEIFALHAKGHEFPVELAITQIPDSDPPLFAGFLRDITSRKIAEQVRRESEERLSLATNAAALGVFEWRLLEDNAIWENERMFEIFGRSLEETPLSPKQMLTEAIIHEDREKFARDLEEAKKPNSIFQSVCRIARKNDGKIRTVEFAGRFEHSSEGETFRLVGIVADISERIEAEEAQLLHAQEIGVLNARLKRAMQETHHRVKNNLQVIAALVDIQATELGDSPAVQRIKQYVLTLAALHDLLTSQTSGSDEIDRISTKDILNKLIVILKEMSGGRKIESDVTDAILNVKEAASLSLLISEAISNAIKHSSGDINISLKLQGQEVVLEICDNGAGFADDFHPERSANTGLQLIDSITHWDLRGNVKFANKPGAGGCVTVTFPYNPPSEPTHILESQ